MIPVADPDALLRHARGLASRNGNGLLISGGCDRNGRIPLGPYLDAIAQVKRESSLLINVHTGLLDRKSAESLVRASPDRLSVDVVQDRQVIRDLMHLRVGPDAYRETLVNLSDSGAERIVPHICVGLSESEEGERAALRLVREFEIYALVVLVLIPPNGISPYKPPPVDDARVIDFIKEAVDSLKCPVLLGCMRPRGNWALEVDCIDAGISGVAVPSRRTVAIMKESGLELEVREMCCALYR